MAARLLVVALLSLITFSNAFSLHRRAAIDDCLTKAAVPMDKAGSANFTADIKPFNARLPYTPAAVAVPTTIPQIQAAVNCGRTTGLKVSAKGGGHSYASSGLGGENGHLVVQLDRMFNVTLNKVTNVATVQPGARLGHVANELFKQGKRAISAGTCPGVGVSGHSLHGGYGMSSHKYGLATDWIVGMTVVLANGTIAQCSATQNPELFWALRGSGSNYGIVASYEFATFAAPAEVTYFSMPAKWNVTTAPGYLTAVENYTKAAMPADLTMRMYGSNGQHYFEGMFFGDVAGLKTALKPLQDKIPDLKLQTAVNTTWMKAFEHYAYADTDPTTPYSAQETFYAKSLTLKSLSGTSLRNFVDYWYKTGPKNNRMWWFQLDLHGGDNSAVTNGDFSASSYAHRDKLYLIQFYDRNFFGSYPTNGFEFLDNWVSNVTAPMPKDDWGMYINYADSRLNRTAAGQAYYGKSHARLQMLKAVYDPAELFYYPQSVQPMA